MPTLERTLRRLYADLVRRRAAVRVVTAAEPALAEPPIFVLGVYRSGTTLLRYVLDSHSRIACPPETSFLATLAELVDDPRNANGFAGMGFDRDQVLARARLFAAYFFEAYARSWGKPRWADKSPHAVDHGGFLAELFPSARFLGVVRHALDQIHSITQKPDLVDGVLGPLRIGDEDLRLTAARYWADRSRRLADFVDQHADRAMLVRYEEMAGDPGRVLPPVFAFLGEAWEPQVLKFQGQRHDHGAEDGWVASSTGFGVSSGGYSAWPPDVTEACNRIAAAALQRLGYGEVP